MIIDVAKLNINDRVKAKQTVAAYLKEQRTLNLPSEDSRFTDLKFQPLEDAVTEADKKLAAAKTKDRPVAEFQLIFAAALARDMEYAMAGRKALTAMSYNDAMFRSFHPTISAVKIGAQS